MRICENFDRWFVPEVPDLFRHACLMGLEGLVSKLRDRPYRPGRSPHWVKIKNRSHPAFSRVMEQLGR
jgi:bifunctional non-homologous end joining protein LigD